MKDYIQLKDVTLESLQKTTTELINSMGIDVAVIYQNNNHSDFIVTFPKGISNELFIFFYCALMAEDYTKSRDLLGWFFANDDMTILNAKGDDFGTFKSKQFSKRIMMTPNYDEEGNIHQHGVIETGQEIRFGMDGTYKTQAVTQLNYFQPITSLNDYTKIETIEKTFVEEAKGCFASIKSLLGF